MPSEDADENDRFQPDLEHGYPSQDQMHRGAQAYGQGNQLNMTGGIHVTADNLYCNFCHIVSCSFGVLPTSVRDTWLRFHDWLTKRPVRNPLIVAALSVTTLALVAAVVAAAKDSSAYADHGAHHHDHGRAADAAVIHWHGAGAPSITYTRHGRATVCSNGACAASSNVCVEGVVEV